MSDLPKTKASIIAPIPWVRTRAGWAPDQGAVRNPRPAVGAGGRGLHQTQARPGGARPARGAADRGRPRPRRAAGRWSKPSAAAGSGGRSAKTRSRRPWPQGHRRRAYAPPGPLRAADTAPSPIWCCSSASTAQARPRPSARSPPTWKGRGAKVLIGAGDTFRAAAIEQLSVWADRAGVPIVTNPPGLRRRRPGLRRGLPAPGPRGSTWC